MLTLAELLGSTQLATLPLQALRMAGWPESSGRLVKLLRAEWAIMRNVEVLFSRVLYVTNLRTVSPSLFPGLASAHAWSSSELNSGALTSGCFSLGSATESSPPALQAQCLRRLGSDASVLCDRGLEAITC